MEEILKLLEKSGVTQKENFKLFHEGTRDRDDINILKCINSNVIILDRVHTNNEYYSENKNYTTYGKTELLNGEFLKTFEINDDKRRLSSYKELVKNKSVLDFGCGKGEFIKLIKPHAKKVAGVELNKINKKTLNDQGYDVRFKVDSFSEKFDFIFLNHVLEHLNKPIEILNNLKSFLKQDGKLIIEIPHANDFLISKLNNSSFKKFTFWSEHLILHTIDSLRKTFNYLGYQDEKISCIQRYPISNHFYWLNVGKPGGHVEYDFLNDKDLNESYINFLKKNKNTDTLIGIFKLKL